MSKTHWKTLTSTEYLGAYSIPDGKDLVLTIDRVAKERVTGNNGKKEELMVCHFKERDTLPMILNKTNAKTITKLVGSPFVEEWSGHKIALYADTTRFGGEIVECLRIRSYAPKEESATVICEKCGKEIKAVPEWNYSAAQVAESTKKKFGKQLCAECAMSESDKGEKK
jgi:hypothetical protein